MLIYPFYENGWTFETVVYQFSELSHRRLREEELRRRRQVEGNGIGNGVGNGGEAGVMNEQVQ